MDGAGDVPDLGALVEWARDWIDPLPGLPGEAPHPDTLPALSSSLAAAIGSFVSDAASDPDQALLVVIETARAALSHSLLALATAARLRFASTSELADANGAIAFGRAALDATVQGSIEHAERQVDLAVTLRARRTIDPADAHSVDEAITLATEAHESLVGKEVIAAGHDATAGTRTWHAGLAAATGILAELHGVRFEGRGDGADLDRALDLARDALARASSDAMRATADNRLALLLRLRHDHRGDDRDLDEAIVHAQASIDATPSDDPEYPVRLGNLGLRLATRFNVTGIPADLDRSINLARVGLAVDGLSPHERRRLLGNLAIRLKTRHTQAADPADLDAAVVFEEEAMALAPAGTTHPLWLLNNLGISISARYTSRGDPADLDRAIVLAEAALDLSTPGDADRPSRLSNLSLVTSTRYEHRGDPADLDRAINLSGQSVADTPPGSPFLQIRQHNHGTHLAIRYDRRGVPQDLDEAIELAHASIGGTPEDSPDRPSRLANLALRLGARFAGQGRIDDLADAIRHAEQALSLTPPSALERPARLANLAIAVAQRWRRAWAGGIAATRVREALDRDLDRAIDLTTEALGLMHAGDPERATHLASLAGFRQWRHDLLGDPADRMAAIEVAGAAVAATPLGHASRAARLATFASLLGATADAADATRALSLHREAWSAVTGEAGFAGFAVVAIGNGLASALRPDFTTAGDGALHEWSTVLSVTLDALDAYLARLPLDADAAALFAVGTYGHLHVWMIEAAVAQVEAAARRGVSVDSLVRATFTAIERSKARRLVSRLQAGALRPTEATQPLVDALERLKPELDRLETLLFGGGEGGRATLGWSRVSEGPTDHSRPQEAQDPPVLVPAWGGNRAPGALASLGWLREGTTISDSLFFPTSSGQGDVRAGGTFDPLVHDGLVWATDRFTARAVAESDRLVARHAEVRAQFAELLRQIERSDPSYAKARGYAAPRAPEEVARSLPTGGSLLMLAPLPSRTVVVVVRAGDGDEHTLSLASVAITDAQWASIVERVFDGGTGDTLEALDRELDGALRAIADRLIPAIAPQLPYIDDGRPGPAGGHLVLVPTGAMHRLPLHAMPWAPRGIARWDGTTRLVDRYPVSYASTADLLPLVEARRVAPGGVVSLAPGLGLRPGDVEPHATVALAVGLACVARSRRTCEDAPADVVLRLRAGASRDAILGQSVLAARRFGFVATHGRAGRAVGSGLLVHAGLPVAAGPGSTPSPAPEPTGTWVTAAELLARLDLAGVDHLQMLACSTHADDPAPGDHLSSLLAALLICGARSVGGTLWAVNEVTAVLVGLKVGTALIGGETDKARALRDATRWLRLASSEEVASTLAELGASIAGALPADDPAHAAVAALATHVAARSQPGDPPFGDVVHWAPYVLHGAPIVGHRS